MHLKSVTFKNIQSLKNVRFDFAPGINVLVGLNETGKSVLSKLLKVLAYPDLRGSDTLSYLISDGCDKGESLWEFINGDLVYFVISHASATYYYSNDRGENWTTWNTNRVPQKIADLFSFVLNDEDKLVVNVIDLDQNNLFVGANPKVNYSALSLITEDEDLKTIENHCSEQIKAYREYIKIIDSKVDYFTNAIGNFAYVNVDKLENEVIEYENNLSIFTPLDKVVESINILGEEPTFNLELLSYMDIFKYIDDILKGLDSLKFEPSYIDLHDYFELFSLIDDILKFEQKEPVIGENVSTYFDLLDEIDNLNNSFETLEEPVRDVRFSNMGKIETAMQMKEKVDNLSICLDKFILTLRGIDGVKNNIEDAHIAIHKFEEEEGFCPLCERRFEV